MAFTLVDDLLLRTLGDSADIRRFNSISGSSVVSSSTSCEGKKVVRGVSKEKRGSRRLYLDFGKCYWLSSVSVLRSSFASR